MRASEVAAKEIEDLKRSLMHAKAMEERYSKAYFACYHNWNNRCMRAVPQLDPIDPLDEAIYEVVRKSTNTETTAAR